MMNNSNSQQQQTTSNPTHKHSSNVTSPNGSSNQSSPESNLSKTIHQHMKSNASNTLQQQQQQQHSQPDMDSQKVLESELDVSSDMMKQQQQQNMTFDLTEQQLFQLSQNNPELLSQIMGIRGFSSYLNPPQQQHMQFSANPMQFQPQTANPNQILMGGTTTSPNRHTPSLSQQNMRTPTPTEQARRSSAVAMTGDTGDVDWSQDEINRLKEALQKYPIDMNSLDRTQCANISAIVRTKTPNEVANFLMHLQKQKLSNQERKSMPTPQPRTGSVPPQPNPSQQSQVISQGAQQNQQRKRKSITADANPKPTKIAKEMGFTQTGVPNQPQLTQQTPQHMTINPAQMGHMYAPQQQMHQNPQLRTVSQQMPPQQQQQQSQQESEEHVNRLLSENNKIIATIRDNITQHKVTSNITMISKFRENIIQVLTCMAKMSGVMSQMPPIPVKLNTICIPLQQVSTGTGQAQTIGNVQHALPPQQQYYQTGTNVNVAQMRPQV